MRYSSILVLLISLPGWSQTASTGQASTDAPCSIANTGSGNKIQINCVIGKEQGQKMLAILNKILANRLDSQRVMAKLDEILKAVNPNVAPRVYGCNGVWRTAGPSATAAIAVNNGGDTTAYEEMIRLNNSKHYAELLQACRGQIDSTPAWLTPRLFCGLAYFGLGDETKAKEELAEFDSKTGPPYDTPACAQMSDFLHKSLQ